MLHLRTHQLRISLQVKKSKVSGERMKEAIFINQGLFALGKCVDALNEEAGFVPYQVTHSG